MTGDGRARFSPCRGTAAAAIGAACWPQTAWAHRPGLSTGRLAEDQVALTFSFVEVDAHLKIQDMAGIQRLIDTTLGRLELSVDGQLCAFGTAQVERVAKGGIQITAPHDCGVGDQWTWDATFLDLFDPAHRHVVEAFGVPVAVLDPGRPTVTFAPLEATSVAGAFGRLGVEHILTGTDHLAFLLALLLVARTFKGIALLVTGFTVAHSITLVLAAMGWIRLSPDLVEPAIALTVAWVGLENLWDPPERRRFFLTLGLGLIHGFGFAGQLGEVAMPTAHRLLALVCFNLGVEVGQLCFVVVLLPGLLWLRRWERWTNRGVPALSLAIMVAGLVWFGARVLG